MVRKKYGVLAILVVVALVLSVLATQFGVFAAGKNINSAGSKMFFPVIDGSSSGSIASDADKSMMLAPSQGMDPEMVRTIVENFGGQLTDSIPQIGVYKAYFPAGIPSKRMLKSLKNLLGARYVEPEVVFTLLDTTPNDPRYGDQWAHSKIQSPKAWDVTQGSKDVVVAIVDTGVDLNHPDLKGRLTPRSTWYDYGEDDDDPSDTYGHGTHCAGIAAATGNNGEGVAGAGWKTSIMPVKVFPDGSGSTDTSRIAKGIVHAVDNGANIVSLSLGSTSQSSTLKDAIDYAYDHHVLVVAAAGNDGKEERYYPAAYDHVIAVAASGTDDKKADFSNYGTWVDITAPGVSILSTMPTYHVKMNDNGYKQDYDYMSGTSMATPLVAGVAALVEAVHPGWGPDQVEDALENGADDIDGKNPDYRGKLGSGRLNSGKAVAGSSSEPTATPTTAPTNTPAPTATPTAMPTNTPAPTATPTAMPTNTPAPTATPTAMPTNTPAPTAIPTTAPTVTPEPTGQPSPTPTPGSTPPNLLPNPSFEFGNFFTGMPDGWFSSGAGTAWVSNQSSDGSRSLSVGGCMFFDCGDWTSKAIPVDPGDSFEFKGDLMYTAGITPGIALEQFDSMGNPLGAITLPVTVSNQIDIWTSWMADFGQGTDFEMSPETVKVKVKLFIDGMSMPGTVWFDDLYMGDISKP